MKYVYAVIAVILIGLLIYVFWPREPVDAPADITMVKSLQDKLTAAETKRTAVIAMARKDSAEHAAVNMVKDYEILRLKRAAAKSRTPHVDTVLIQDLEVGRYAAMLDSLVVTQDSQISQLKEQKAEQWASFNQLITASDSTFKANQGLNDYLLETEKQRTKKAKNKRFGIGPHIGYDFRNKVTFGASVNFDLIRF